jgi:succinate dehydrogenase/fumarate reductase flavoprotein subunit
MSNLSRRSFLTGAATTSLGAAAASMAAGSVALAAEADEAAEAASSWKVAPEPVDAADITATYEADVIVVGHGHAGITATREIAEEGKSVICLEKQFEENYMPNGNEGGIINNSYLVNNQGVEPVDPTDFYLNWQRTAGNTVNPGLLMKYCQNAGANSDWYLEGLTEEDLDTAFIAYRNTATADPAEVANGYYDHVLTEVDGFKSYTSSLGFYGSVSQTDIHRLNREAAQAAGAQFFFGTTAKYLLQDESGAVTGVVAVDEDDNYVQYNAKAVVLATGGAGCNPEMILDICNDVQSFLTPDEIANFGTSMDGRYGDGIAMGYWAGAAVEHDAATMGMKASGDGWPCGIWLDENGKRFTNEFWGQAEQRGNHNLFMAREPHYTIYGADLFDTVQYCTPSHASTKPNLLFMDCLEQAIDQAVESDDIVTVSGEYMTNVSIYGANTIEELMAKMGCTDEQVIANAKASVERYNELCAAGADADFARNPELMFPLAEEGPFYGQVKTAGVATCMTTLGGLITNAEQQVLDRNFKPISGLFASGNTCGRRFGRDYFTPISGMSLGFGWVLGRECGKSVVAWLDEQ